MFSLVLLLRSPFLPPCRVRRVLCVLTVFSVFLPVFLFPLSLSLFSFCHQVKDKLDEEEEEEEEDV